jgi:hypothetical protein
MTSRSAQRPPAAAPEPVSVDVAAELTRLNAVCAGLAGGLIEAREEIRELRAALPPSALPVAAGFVPAKAAAFEVGFSEESVRRWCRQGEIDASLKGGHWFARMDGDRGVRSRAGGNRPGRDFSMQRVRLTAG